MLIISDHLFLGDFRLSGSKDEEARLFNNLRNHTCLLLLLVYVCALYMIVRAFICLSHNAPMLLTPAVGR